MKIGIDKIAFYTSAYYLDLATLAAMRGSDVNKFHIGLGQRKMAVAAPDEDVVTLGANAAKQLLQDIDVQQIDTLLFATESGIDQSKAAGVYVHALLNLPKRCRVVELKQACYAATFALQTAVSLVRQRPEKKVLLIAADIARYGLHTSGESSQGCGAVALLISANPRVLALEAESGLYTDDVADFWRPNYRREALVEGKYSTKMYLYALQQTFAHYVELSGRHFVDHDYFLYHMPVPRLVEKAHKVLAAQHQLILSDEQVKQQLQSSLHYAREIGNSYTASLYIGLVSLCDNTIQDLAAKRIGFYSYGSGCVAEYFSGVIQPEYRTGVDHAFHQNLLATRKALSGDEYERFFNMRLPEDGSPMQLPEYNQGAFRLSGIENHKRRYAKVSKVKQKMASKASSYAVSPGKLILSGEYAVIYGKPAIAIAVNRFVKTSITSGENDNVVFDLFDLHYHKSVALNTLRTLKTSLKKKYKKFLTEECTIRDVLKQPFHLVQFAAVHLMDHISPRRINGLKIETQSDIPVGCGMGSSAAVTLSVLRALNEYYQLDFDEQQYLTLGFEAEKLQHGHPSMLDLQTVLHGGCIYFHDGRMQTRPLPHVPMFLVNTGTPDASTGESVQQVTQHFANDNIWDEFARVTTTLDHALQTNDLAMVQDLIRDNHRLLHRIGIVPKKVHDFILGVEQLGAAAKVCGAGSITGESAGAVLVITRSIEEIKPLCKQYDYTIEPVEVVPQSLQAA